MSPEEGTIEFWQRAKWPEECNRGSVYWGLLFSSHNEQKQRLDIYDGWRGHLNCRRVGANFFDGSVSGGYQHHYAVGVTTDWNESEWHHIGVSWERGENGNCWY